MSVEVITFTGHRSLPSCIDGILDKPRALCSVGLEHHAQAPVYGRVSRRPMGTYVWGRGAGSRVSPSSSNPFSI